MNIIQKLRKNKKVVTALVVIIATAAFGLSDDKAEIVGNVTALALEIAGSN